MFDLTVLDPADDTDDGPDLSLDAWIRGHRLGTVSWRPDLHEGIGVRFSDGVHALAEPSFGDARSLARNCEVAADRLAAGELALLRTAILDVGSYVLLVPRHEVWVVQAHDRPLGGDPFPYRPSRRNDDDAEITALYRWAEAEAGRLLSPSGNPAWDRARGLGLRSPLGPLVDDLRRNARLAESAAELLGVGGFGPTTPWPARS